MVTEADVLANQRGSVIAPAGCGKTELIVRAIAGPSGAGSLVLTHTHAGVGALRSRLRRLGVDRRRAKVETIAGWCLRYSLAYPSTSGLSTARPMGGEWGSVYAGALRLLSLGAIQRVVRESYSRVFVDEYQDCTSAQHDVVVALAGIVPVCVLGDPLQGIFGFAGDCLSWNGEVEPAFPPIGSLSTPWRWKGKNDELGEWLLYLREPLTHGNPVDLASGPISWALSTQENQRKAAYSLAKAGGNAIALRKWPSDAHRFARSMSGLFPSMEEAECGDLLKFAARLDASEGTARIAHLCRFAADCFTLVGPVLEAVAKQLESGNIPNPARYQKIGPIVSVLADAAGTATPEKLRRAMTSIEMIKDSHLFRGELWRETARALTAVEREGFTTILEAAWTLRNRLRVVGRTTDVRSVSRTLLVKGLEFDHALVLDAEEYEQARRPGDGARHFYVAATRGARSLTVLAQSNVVQFSAPIL